MKNTELDLCKTSQNSGSSRGNGKELLSERDEPVGSSKEETTSYRSTGGSEIAGILRKSSRTHLKTHDGTVASYTIGFMLSIICTLIPYIIVVGHTLSGGWLFFALFGFAIAQLFIQAKFFLHLGSESKPRWNLFGFLFMLLIVFIVVAGSIWIMRNLNYHSVPPEEVDNYLLENEGIRRQ